MRNEQETENLLDLLYKIVKWHVYDEVADADISGDYWYDMIAALYRADEERFDAAKREALLELRKDGFEDWQIKAAGYEPPEELL